jgi:hypothetical protein
MFGMPKGELDFRYWPGCHRSASHKQSREKGIFCFFYSQHVGESPQESFARAAVLHGTRYVLPVVNGVQCCCSVAVQRER